MLSHKILVVDDEEPLSEMMLEVLQIQGYHHVESASNGEEGYEKYKALHPDLVIMDIEMPVMDGYDSSSKIKSFDPHAKILVLTGDPRDSLAQKNLSESKLIIKIDSHSTFSKKIHKHRIQLNQKMNPKKISLYSSQFGFG
jgi:two-component system chemotaxis response regulator CheY